MLRTIVLSCVVAAMAGVWAQKASAEVKLDAAQIKVGLRTVTPNDEGFVDRVVKMTNDGRLPVSLVDSTFQWARKKSQNQFQYFKRALILRAAKQGITIAS
jgi:hypothetical protein